MEAFMKFMVGLEGGLSFMWVGEGLILKLHFFSHSWTWFYCIIISSSSTTISPLRDMCVHNRFSLFRVSSTHH